VACHAQGQIRALITGSCVARPWQGGAKRLPLGRGGRGPASG